jgi:hypothetical protein
MAACATHANMACWVHQDSILDDEEVSQSLQEAWEHEGSKDELKIELQGLGTTLLARHRGGASSVL